MGQRLRCMLRPVSVHYSLSRLAGSPGSLYSRDLAQVVVVMGGDEVERGGYIERPGYGVAEAENLCALGSRRFEECRHPRTQIRPLFRGPLERRVLRRDDSSRGGWHAKAASKDKSHHPGTDPVPPPAAHSGPRLSIHRLEYQLIEEHQVLGDLQHRPCIRGRMVAQQRIIQRLQPGDERVAAVLYRVEMGLQR